MLKQSLVEPSFHTGCVNYRKLFRLQRQCQEKKVMLPFSLTLFLKGKKWEHVFFPQQYPERTFSSALQHNTN